MIKNNIVTKETLKIFGVTSFLYALSLFFFKYHLTWWTLSLLIIVVGGIANLYVIDFNNNKMPVRAGSRAIDIIRKKYPKRGFCQLTSKTKFQWFADRFYVGKSIYSIGDFVILFGIVMTFFPIILGTIILIL